MAVENVNEARKNGVGGKAPSFFSGVVLLSVSTVLVKVIGLGCKIPLIAILGAEGMGYFNSAYEIYALFCTLATAGLPVAISVLVAAANERGDEAESRRIYRSAVRLFFVMGVVGTVGMLVFSEAIATYVGNADANLGIAVIAPSLFCICMSSAVRGYFQGCHRMGPTAVSQLLEAMGKLIFGVWLAAEAIRSGKSISVAAAYAIGGITVGTVISTLYLFVVKAVHNRRNRKREVLPNCGRTRGQLLPLLRIAFPVTVSAAVLGITRMVDMSLILRRLCDMGTALSEANEIYGSYTTLAVPVFGLIPALITPVALSLIPKLSAAIEVRTREGQARVVNDSLRLTVLLALPASMGIALYATPILTVLFSGEPEAIAIAAPLLSALGASVFFSCMITTTNAILQAYRRQRIPVISTAIGAGVKIVSAYVLVGAPGIGIFGAPISTFLCNLTITALNLRFVSVCVPKNESTVRLYWRPLVASVGAMLLSLAAYLPVLHYTQSTVVGFVAAAPTAIAAYGVLCILTGAIGKEELSFLTQRRKRKKKKLSA